MIRPLERDSTLPLSCWDPYTPCYRPLVAHIHRQSASSDYINMQYVEYICRPDRGSRFCFGTVLFGRAGFYFSGPKPKWQLSGGAGVLKPLDPKGFTETLKQCRNIGIGFI